MNEYIKKTKIVCTIGPASWDVNVLRKMIENGMNCARVNGAFADTEELDKVKNLVRSISDNVSLMLDVKGPEIRLNKFAAPLTLTIGTEIIIGGTIDSELYPANYIELYKYVKAGQKILVGDGDVELEVTKIVGKDMYCKVIMGEKLLPGKALNLPGCEYSTEVLTKKDKENLTHAMKTGWDFVSPSFIQNKESAQQVSEYIKNSQLKIIAKIENQAGIDNIDEILEVVDGIMIARGGLGIELGLAKVPNAQRLLIKKANAVGKIVITATQMLESMVNNSKPTRAEVNDVATAVFMGTDAVMLSGESSAGKFPAEAVAVMSEISKEIEPTIVPEINNYHSVGANVTAEILAKAAATICIEKKTKISKVIVVSKTGTTARAIAKHCIRQPIIAFTSTEYNARQLLLTKNIQTAMMQEATTENRDDAVTHIIDIVKQKQLVTKGEKVLLLCKTPFDGDNYFPNVFEIIEIS